MIRMVPSLLSLALLSLSLACTSDGHPEYECDGNEQATSAGTMSMGLGGDLRITLLDAEPGIQRPASYNELKIRVEDPTGNAMAGASIDDILVAATKDDAVAAAPTVAPMANPGEFDVTEIQYAHEGPWKVSFDVSADSMADTVPFTFCIYPVPGGGGGGGGGGGW